MEDISIKEEVKQYIVVQLDNEQYGIDIQYIDNIVRMQRITRVPKAQSYFMGVINLRGEVMPVMSLRLKFGLEDDKITNKTRIIIIKLDPQSTVGIIVDQVKEVVTMEPENIEKVQNTTDKKMGILRQLADQEGYKIFYVPDDIGGRFSVFSSVGLVPFALVGLNIDKMINGINIEGLKNSICGICSIIAIVFLAMMIKKSLF